MSVILFHYHDIEIYITTLSISYILYIYLLLSRGGTKPIIQLMIIF